MIKLKMILSPLVLAFFLTFSLPSKSNAADKLVFHENFDSIAENGLPVGWEAWKPKNMEMVFESSNDFIFSGELSYRMTSNGKYHTKGSLKKKIEGFVQGRYYKFNVYYKTEGIDQGIQTKVLPIIKWGKGINFKHIVPVEFKDGWFRADLIHQIPEDSNGEIFLELFAGWIPEGSVYWGEIEIFELEKYIPESKIINVAVVDKIPPQVCSLMENCEFYVSQIDNACKNSALDAICLTEEFNILKVLPRDDWENAVSMDSEYMQKIMHAARNNNVNVIGSILEDDNGVLFNTGFLINRQGELVDKYHKAQLAMTEILYSNTSRGDELIVMQADFGKIGIAICWDYQFPEFNRTLALKGVDIIFVPIAGDERISESGVGTGMEHVGKTITLENRIPIVFAKRGGNPRNPSRIIDNGGVVVAESADKSAFISAPLDLKSKHYMWNKSEYTRAYYTSRRLELYKELVNDSILLFKEGP